MVLTKDDFLRRWNSGPDGGGITNDDCADCYVAWGLGVSPRTMPISKVVARVVEAAETFCKDKEVVGMASGQQQDSFDAIVQYLRGDAKDLRNGVLSFVGPDKLDWLADRIEAAAKRRIASLNAALANCRKYAQKIERENDEGETRLDAEEIIATVDNAAKCIAQKALEGEQCPPQIAQEKPKIEQPGNAVALREALKQVQIGFDGNVLGPIGDVPNDWEIAEAKRLCKVVDSALAAPPRNCDVGTPTGQARRFQLFCQQHRDIDAECSTMCPFVDTADINHCQAGWAQMPYEEGGAE
jgi:hypothetical protein